MKIIKLQEVIFDKKGERLSIEKIIKFLNSAMNYGEFQIWLLRTHWKGIKLNLNDKLKKFLIETSMEEILLLYDIEQNYDDIKKRKKFTIKEK